MELVRAAAWMLSLVFAWAGVAKLVDLDGWRKAYAAYSIPGPRHAWLVVPAAELAVALMLVSGATRAGAAFAAALLSVFSLAVLRARAMHGDRLPCGCFGRSAARDYRMILLRNAGLAGIAAVALLSRRDVALLGDGAPLPELLPVILTVAGVSIGAWTVYQALLHLRTRQHP